LTNYPRFVLYIVLNISFIQTLANYMHANNDAWVFNLHLSVSTHLVQHDIQFFPCKYSSCHSLLNISLCFIIWYYNFSLIDGLEFFNRNYIKDESYDFAKHRRELKQIVRSKVKNNVCNHHPRRKKLGGHKAQKFIKYT